MKKQRPKNKRKLHKKYIVVGVEIAAV